MKTIQKKDLINTFQYSELKSKWQKENTKWQWIILIGCFLMQMVPACIVMNLNGALSGSDWSRWVGNNPLYIGLTFTIGSVVSAILGPYIARIFSKQINMRVVYAIGICASMIGFMGYSINAILTKVYGHIPSLSTVLPILWIMYAISQIGAMVFSGIGINNLISRWWPANKRGFALGIAFAGGSFGNIWMQQVLKVLTQTFGNIRGANYNYYGNQFATYIILGSMGLVCGLIVVMFICRKPIPSIELLNDEQFNKNIKDNDILSANKLQNVAVTPLNTRKYPPYWILCIGFMLIQVGVIHSSSNGLIIANTVCHDRENLYSSLMATGGTIFGVAALIGNVSGGIINDKAGPWKSILYAGTLQILAILCLMFSIQQDALVYIYFLLAGLSAYLYISTPGFINGRLYGAKYSNSHMSIMSIFTAVGFAISNSLMGVLTGPTSEIHYLLGKPTGGNFENLLLFAIITMGSGVIISTICCYIIQKKGVVGLSQFISSKYTYVISRYALNINFHAKKICFLKHDYRNNEKWLNKLEEKNKKDKYFYCINDFAKVINESFKDQKLSKEELMFLTYLYFFRIINIGRLIKYTNIHDYEKTMHKLIKKELVYTLKLNKDDKIFSLTDKAYNIINQHQNDLLNKYPLIFKQNDLIIKQLKKVDDKHDQKIVKINHKLDEAKNIKIDQNKVDLITKKVDDKIISLNKKHEIIAHKYANDLWKAYQKEINILNKINALHNKIHKQENNKQFKINKLNNKMIKINTSCDFYNQNEIIGHDLLINFYNDKNSIINHLITKKVDKILDDKINLLTLKLQKQENNYQKIFDSKR